MYLLQTDEFLSTNKAKGVTVLCHIFPLKNNPLKESANK